VYPSSSLMYMRMQLNSDLLAGCVTCLEQLQTALHHSADAGSLQFMLASQQGLLTLPAPKRCELLSCNNLICIVGNTPLWHQQALTRCGSWGALRTRQQVPQMSAGAPWLRCSCSTCQPYASAAMPMETVLQVDFAWLRCAHVCSCVGCAVWIMIPDAVRWHSIGYDLLRLDASWLNERLSAGRQT